MEMNETSNLQITLKLFYNTSNNLLSKTWIEDQSTKKKLQPLIPEHEWWVIIDCRERLQVEGA